MPIRMLQGLRGLLATHPTTPNWRNEDGDKKGNKSSKKFQDDPIMKTLRPAGNRIFTGKEANQPWQDSREYKQGANITLHD